jgi:hypothetical protein
MELIVFRKYFGEKYTIGRFYIDDKLICDTLEPPVRILKDLNGDGDFLDPGEGKIMGHTAIPCCRVRVTMEMFLRHNRMTPMLHNVPGFTEIFCHNVEDVSWTAGCVGVGENKIKGRLVNGGYWESYISKLVTDAINAGQEVWCTIKQQDPYKCS